MVQSCAEVQIQQSECRGAEVHQMCRGHAPEVGQTRLRGAVLMRCSGDEVLKFSSSRGAEVQQRFSRGAGTEVQWRRVCAEGEEVLGCS